MYTPDYQKQLIPTDPLGGLSCTCYAGAMAGQFDTLGAKRPLGKDVRHYCLNPDGTRDVTGGTTLPQVDHALLHWGIDLDTRIGWRSLTWAEFEHAVDSGRGAILQGGYLTIRNSQFRGSETFGGNHAMFVPPGWTVMDPLADGRRPGLYRYHGETYPRPLLRRFAEDLDIGSPGHPHKAGPDNVWCALTRDRVADWKATIRPLPGNTRRAFANYAVVSGVIDRKDSHPDKTAGLEVPCSPPRAIRDPNGGYRYLVELLAGVRAGRWVAAGWASESSVDVVNRVRA